MDFLTRLSPCWSTRLQYCARPSAAAHQARADKPTHESLLTLATGLSSDIGVNLTVHSGQRAEHLLYRGAAAALADISPHAA